MSSVEERYSRAIQSSHLEATEYVGDVDSLIAAGWIRDSLATTLYRLRVEFDACDLRSIRPLAPQPVPPNCGAEIYDADINGMREATKDERDEKVRAWAAVEAARVEKEFKARRVTAKALAMVHMKSLPAARDAMGRFVMAEATRQGLKIQPEDELRVAGRVLDYLLDPQCEVCNGVKFKAVPGTGRLSNMACGSCDGSGRRRLRFTGNTAAAESYLARSVLADIERKMDRVNKLMWRFTRAVVHARTIRMPPGAKAARPRLGEDGRVFYEFSNGRGWYRADAAVSCS